MPCYDKSILKLILVKAAILDLLCYLQGGIMAQSNLTAHEVKKINRTKVFQYIYEQRQTSRPDIATALHLSFPTVSQNLVDLEESGLIEKGDFLESTGGRKAQCLLCRATSRIAVGMEILREFVSVSVIDLYGTVLAHHIINLPYSNDPYYFLEVCRALNEFIAALPYDPSVILGIGIAIQGLISPDGQTVTFGKVLGHTGLSLDHFQEHLNYPCIFLHDSKVAASAQIWFQKEITNAVYVSLNRNIGGAVILNGTVFEGNSLISGTLEHMCLIPGGKPCYCGKCGCVESYCSANALKEEAGESLELFFAKLRSGETHEIQVWDTFLHHLARVISNIRNILDVDFLLGGFLNAYFCPEDYETLSCLAAENCGISDEKVRILSGSHDDQITSIGAGLYYIRAFLEQI